MAGRYQPLKSLESTRKREEPKFLYVKRKRVVPFARDCHGVIRFEGPESDKITGEAYGWGEKLLVKALLIYQIARGIDSYPQDRNMFLSVKRSEYITKKLICYCQRIARTLVVKMWPRRGHCKMSNR